MFNSSYNYKAKFLKFKLCLQKMKTVEIHHYHILNCFVPDYFIKYMGDDTNIGRARHLPHISGKK